MIVKRIDFKAYSFDKDKVVKVEEADGFVDPDKVYGFDRENDYIMIRPDRLLPYTFLNDINGKKFYLNDVVEITLGNFTYYRMIDFDEDIGYYIEISNNILPSDNILLTKIHNTVENMGSVYCNRDLELGRLSDFALDREV